MDPWGNTRWQGQESPGQPFRPELFNAQHGGPALLPQRRRPLAVHDMLNHDPPPSQPRDEGHRAPRQNPSPFFPTPYFTSLDPYRPGPAYQSSVHDRRDFSPISAPRPPIAMAQNNRGDYMSHPQAFPPPYTTPYHMNLPQPAQTSQLVPPQNLGAPLGYRGTPLRIPRMKACVLCLEEFDETDPRSHFPHQCKRCSSGDFCAECLKDWFIDACRNEGKMPPKCCSVVPLAAVAELLDHSQIELYKAKYEEWSTQDRMYCPVPKCSAFVPQRLYINIGPGHSTRPSGQLNPTIFSGQAQSTSPKKDVKPLVGCPTCGISICTKCRSFSHIGHCTESDIDPGLEEQLKKWKIKRCPKCRAGVRKMYGCSHIECRCGAHFCWECLLPINQCGGKCDDSGSEEDPTDYEVEEDDLDGRARYYEDNGPNFGPEPYGNVIDAWGCRHVWMPLLPTSIFAVTGRPLECHRCFRSVRATVKDKPPQAASDEDTHMGGMTPPWPTTYVGGLAWQCYSHHVMCRNCPKEPPPHRHGDASRLWQCDCGKSCFLCDRHAIHARYVKVQKDKEDSLAWECRCGTIVCGACKVTAEHT